MRARRTVLFLALCLLPLPCVALGNAGQADSRPSGGLTAQCRLSSPLEKARLDHLTDNDHGTHLILPAGGCVTAEWDEGAGVRYVYLDWGGMGSGFTVTERDKAGEELFRYPGDNRERRCLVPVAAGAVSLTVTVDAPSRLAGLTALGEGEPLPEGLLPWQPPLQKADMLVVSAHPDDEIVMFGGLIPTYAGQRGYGVQVLYMTMQNKIRYGEARAGLWTMGVRNAPLIGPFLDAEGKSADRYYRIWGGEDRVTGYLVEQIRRLRPLVVVTHDLNGEYGHGAHMVTADCVWKAAQAAADPARYPGSAAAYGAWRVQKLYLHLYPENGVTLDYGAPLTAFDGKTALEVAAEAYACHASQRASWLRHLLAGSYDSTRYGLVLTAVGKDETGADLMENVDFGAQVPAGEEKEVEIGSGLCEQAVDFFTQS